jgi:adenine-specific DNA methylase
MSAPVSIIKLIDRFEAQLSSYRSGKYNETELRRDFLDPFLEALGWDVTNKKEHAEKYREVIHEISVEVEGQAKAADYAIRAGDKAVFLVEAKKPSVNIGINPEPAFQIRRYGWSAKLPINLLTDFEQLAVYDCRSKPILGDSPAVGRIKLYHFKEYVEKWDEIAGVFSRDAVYQGSFDKYAEGMKGKRGTADVDDDFLSEMERWREDLARNIALRNPDLSSREINAAVQTTIDRIIFLRICEERGIEPEDSLRNATDGKDVYQDLMVLFQQADRKYNSGLFHFSAEKNQTSQPDTLAPRLKIDDKVLKDILKHLYYPESPYAFKYIPADILGSVYERFLGKVITLTPGHHAKVEEKPEVRKAGGVYYTPTYIVEYIVKNTVGELLKDKTAEEQKAKPIHIVDPACGSGSFLLGAYQYLLDWYLVWYTGNDPAKWVKGKNPVIFEGRDGWQLTMEEKKGILTRHIFGVDIDAQAVEVTKLSLLLKVVENPGQLNMLDERILPDLGRNIQCGNSLIGSDYYDNQQLTMFDEEEQYRVNAFDWQKSFPQVFAAPSVLRTSPPNAGHLEEKGGFDVVIGNPPYIRIQALKEWAPKEVEFYKKKYEAASKGNYDIYVVFVEKGLSLLNPKGRLGFILPHKFFNAKYGESIRRIIATGKHLTKVVHFGDQQVFDGATTYTCLMFLNKDKQDSFIFESVINLSSWRTELTSNISEFDSNVCKNPEWNFTVGNMSSIISKLKLNTCTLGNIAERIAQGIRTSANEIYVVDFIKSDGYISTVFSKILEKDIHVESSIIYPFLLGREIRRYRILHSGKFVIIPYIIKNGKTSLINTQDLKENYENSYDYFLSNKKVLENRESGKMKNANWYGYVYPKNLEIMSLPKILTPDIADCAQFSLDEKGEYTFTSGYGITLKIDIEVSQKYVLGLLNSNLLNIFLRSISTPMQNGFFRYFSQYLEQLPIRTIDFSNAADVAKHDHMIALVENMLSLHQRLSAAGMPQEKEHLQRQIDQTDRQIDALVYELYGLTEEEIKIVEGR